MKSKTDRRVEKTKKLLWDALVKLILDKGYESLTIQEIIDEANVGRSTFYSHYESKEQLLFSGQPHVMSMLFPTEGESETIDLKAVFQHADENKEMAKALLGKQGGDLLLKHIQGVIQFTLEKVYLKPNIKGKEYQKRVLLVEAAAAGFVSILSGWIEQDMSLGIDEMEELSAKYINDILDNG